MRPRRVVVTGLGAVTPLGKDACTTWQGMVAGRSGVARITLFDPENHEVKIAGEVKGFEPPSIIEPKEARRLDRNVLLAVHAAGDAIADARLTISPDIADDVGCICGTAAGGLKTLIDAQAVYDARGPARV